MASTQSRINPVSNRRRKLDVITKEICDHSRRFDNPYVFISAIRSNPKIPLSDIDEVDVDEMRAQFIRSIPKELDRAWEFLLEKDGLRIVCDVSYKRTLEHVTDDDLMLLYQLIAFLDIEPDYGHTKWITDHQEDFVDELLVSPDKFTNNNDDDNDDNNNKALIIATTTKNNNTVQKLKRNTDKISQLEDWFVQYLAIYRLPEMLETKNGNLPRAMAIIQQLLGIEFDMSPLEFNAYVKYFSSIANLDGLTYENVSKEIANLKK